MSEHIFETSVADGNEQAVQWRRTDVTVASKRTAKALVHRELTEAARRINAGSSAIAATQQAVEATGQEETGE